MMNELVRQWVVWLGDWVSERANE